MTTYPAPPIPEGHDLASTGPGLARAICLGPATVSGMIGKEMTTAAIVLRADGSRMAHKRGLGT